MKILCALPLYNYGDPGRGHGYEATNFLPALTRMGHQVELFDTWDRSFRDFPSLNAALLAHVERFQPELVLTAQMHYEIWGETWQIIRSAGVATVNWATDDSWKYRQFSRLVAPFFDAVASTCSARTKDYGRDGHTNVLITQWAANDATLAAPKPGRSCAISVSFIGSAYGPRRSWIEGFRREGIDVHCFGHGWEHGPVASPRIPELIRDSIVSLNFSAPSQRRSGDAIARSNQIKARNFEVPGAGGFLLTESAPGLERYYSIGEEIEVFSTHSEAIAQMRRYLNDLDARDRVAYAGHCRTISEHTYERRLERVIQFTMEKREQASPGESRDIDWSKFEAAIARHRRTGWMSLAAAALTTAGYLVGGRNRGLRIARRAAHELTWRLTGPTMYTAAGLPGRMFEGLR